jgi:hypothetical protein
MDSVRIVQRGLLVTLDSFLAMLSFFLTQQKQVPQESAAGERIPANCRITLPADGEFVPPSSILLARGPLTGDRFWFGTEKLWTILPRDGTWRGSIQVTSPGDPTDFAYTNPLPWFRSHAAFSLADGPLTVTGKRLDGLAPSFTESFYRWASPR